MGINPARTLLLRGGPERCGLHPPLGVVRVGLEGLLLGRAVELVAEDPVALGVLPGEDGVVARVRHGGEDGLHVLGLHAALQQVVDGGELRVVDAGGVVVPMWGRLRSYSSSSKV